MLLRIITLPIWPFYAFITWFRNWSYDRGIIKSNEFDLPIIGVGNLSLGGTGKTPHTEYIVRLLKDEFKVATLSRGYRRKTKDYLEVQADMEPWQSGDEPLQMKRKFGDDIKVLVDRSRLHGITGGLIEHPELDVFVLDDVFQHRAVKPGINILLTTYQEPYTKDSLIPLGNLREFRKGAKRADIVVVTKCPADLTESARDQFIKELSPEKHQTVYFSKIGYKGFRNEGGEVPLNSGDKVVLVTGIANPEPMVSYLKEMGLEMEHVAFADHHNFSKRDIDRITDIFNNFGASRIVTTEKDFVRLEQWRQPLASSNIELCYLEMTISFLWNGSDLDTTILTYVRENKDNHRVPEGEDQL